MRVCVCLFLFQFVHPGRYTADRDALATLRYDARCVACLCGNLFIKRTFVGPVRFAYGCPLALGCCFFLFEGFPYFPRRSGYSQKTHTHKTLPIFCRFKLNLTDRRRCRSVDIHSLSRWSLLSYVNCFSLPFFGCWLVRWFIIIIIIIMLGKGI